MRLIKGILAIPKLVITLNKINSQIDVLAHAIKFTQERVKLIEHDVKKL